MATKPSRGRKYNRWGSFWGQRSADPYVTDESRHYASKGAPHQLVRGLTEHWSDMQTRRGALKDFHDVVFGRSTPADGGGAPVAGLTTQSGHNAASITKETYDPEISAIVGSHGTVEASPRGVYAGQTVQPGKAQIEKAKQAVRGKPDQEPRPELSDQQKTQVRDSVVREYAARAKAKELGIAYTGGTAEEQAAKAGQRFDQIAERFGADEALARTEPAKMEQFRPGINYTPPAGKGPVEDPNAPKRAAVGGGETEAPAPAPAPAQAGTPLLFSSRESAAAAILERGASMSQQDFAEAAAIAALPRDKEAKGYDPIAAFAAMAVPRLLADLDASFARTTSTAAALEDTYHSANARAVMQATGVTREEYEEALASDDPSMRLFLRTRFMDSL